MSKQLYSFIPNNTSDNSKNFIAPPCQKFDELDGFYSFYWPNGTPCLLVELYLHAKSNKKTTNELDGGSVGVYASQLTHLVRFCYLKGIEFWDFNDNYLDELRTGLINEKDSQGEPLRKNNTISKIIKKIKEFFIWLQLNHCLDRSIIGADTTSLRHQIKIKASSDNKKKSLGDLTKVSISNEKPIPTTLIKQIRDTLAESIYSAEVDNYIQSIFDEKDQKAHIEYMFKRREVQLLLLEQTGLRPQELVKIIATLNNTYLENSQLLIPTLKRRDNVEERLISIDRASSMKIQVFLNKYRKLLIKRLLKYGLICSGQLILATDLYSSQYIFSDSFGVSPPL